MVHGRVKNSRKIMCFKLRFNEMTNSERRIFRGMAFQICGTA